MLCLFLRALMPGCLRKLVRCVVKQVFRVRKNLDLPTSLDLSLCDLREDYRLAETCCQHSELSPRLAPSLLNGLNGLNLIGS